MVFYLVYLVDDKVWALRKLLRLVPDMTYSIRFYHMGSVSWVKLS